jgi:flavin reductase (DIM6/NTAB) family NADH-FMN oxidoreductase RutF
MSGRASAVAADPAVPLRQVARRYATGVTIAGVYDGAAVHALTANSFSTLSLDPPLVGLAVGGYGRFRSAVERAGWFGISILSASQHGYAAHYARRDRSDGASDCPLLPVGPQLGVPVVPIVPVVPGCLGYFVCAVHAVQPVGDHDLVIGRIHACRTGADGSARDPLIFFAGP